LDSIGDLSLLSIDALDDLLSSDSLRVESEDALVTRLLQLGSAYSFLLHHVRFGLLSLESVSALANRFADFSFTESIWEGVAARLPLPRPPPAPPLDSLIVSDFPPLLDEFRAKRFVLLWRGSRDGFGTRDFHGRCDGRANTLTLVLDTKGNVFGGFTPLQWEARVWNGKEGDQSNVYKCDDSLKSFLFTLKNPHDIPARKFASKADQRHRAIGCWDNKGPYFGGAVADMRVSDGCNSSANSHTDLGHMYTNDTGLDEDIVFTGSKDFQVREIEVFEITD
jgi:hypothetical protein